jgi:hypothetical protein
MQMQSCKQCGAAYLWEQQHVCTARAGKAVRTTSVAIDAEANAARYLADANQAKEAGQHAKAERLYALAQRWLDRFNELTGRS